MVIKPLRGKVIIEPVFKEKEGSIILIHSEDTKYQRYPTYGKVVSKGKDVDLNEGDIVHFTALPLADYKDEGKMYFLFNAKDMLAYAMDR